MISGGATMGLNTNQYDFKTRLDRAFQQRIYLLSVERPDENYFRFDVMGATGTVYDVYIHQGGFLSCSCPDHSQNHKLCKHLLFILIRVLKQQMESVFKSYFLTNLFITTSTTFDNCIKFIETADTFIEQNDPAFTRDADPTGKLGGKVSTVPQRPIDDTDCCPICFEEFSTSKEAIIFCKLSCGKSVHKSCFVKWSSKTTSSGVSCVYCRAKWKY